MGHSRDDSTVPAVLTSPAHPNSSGKRRHHHVKQRGRKKQKVILSSETETSNLIQTTKSDLTRTLTCCTRNHADSYVRRQERSRRKSSSTYSQRKWIYSAHDVSNYNGNILYTHRQLFVTHRNAPHL